MMSRRPSATQPLHSNGTAVNMEKKQGRPPLPEAYITGSIVKTSRGTFHHGDRVKLPKEELEALKKRGLAK